MVAMYHQSSCVKGAFFHYIGVCKLCMRSFTYYVGMYVIKYSEG